MSEAMLEAVFFAAAEPLDLHVLSQILGLSLDDTREHVQHFQEKLLNNPQRGIYLREVEEKYALATKPAYSGVLCRLFSEKQAPQLSQAAYEVLAIVAYNQPVTKAQIELVRGVNSDGIVNRLLEYGLIEISGKLQAPGTPSLFVTTEQFLLNFGLSSIAALPPMELLMYGTLQDLEQNLAPDFDRVVQNQVTIDQLLTK